MYSDYRHEKLLHHCVIMAEKIGGLADALENRQSAERVVQWINTKRDTPEFSEETNQDYRVPIGIFRKGYSRWIRFRRLLLVVFRLAGPDEGGT